MNYKLYSTPKEKKHHFCVGNPKGFIFYTYKKNTPEKPFISVNLWICYPSQLINAFYKNYGNHR